MPISCARHDRDPNLTRKLDEVVGYAKCFCAKKIPSEYFHVDQFVEDHITRLEDRKGVLEVSHRGLAIHPVIRDALREAWEVVRGEDQGSVEFIRERRQDPPYLR